MFIGYIGYIFVPILILIAFLNRILPRNNFSMTENDRSPSHQTATQEVSNPSSIMPSPPPIFAHELRIQIEESDHQPGVNMSRRTTPSEFLSIRDATETVQQNISAIFNQARNELERRMNFNSMLQGVRRPRRRSSTASASISPQIDRQLDIPDAEQIQNDETLRIELNSPNRSSLNRNANDITDRQEIEADPITNRSLINRSPSHSQAGELPELPPVPRRSTASGGGGPESTDEIADVLAQVPEARRFLIALSRYVPFVCILLTKSFYDHFESVLNVAGVLGCFYFLNMSLQKQVARQSQWKRWIFARDLFMFISCLAYWSEKNREYNNLLLLKDMKKDISLSILLYSACLTDYTLKSITIFVKNIIAILPARTLNYNRRGSFYLLIESISQLYRSLATIQPWLVFLMYSYEGAGKFFSGILLTAYVAVKFWYIVDKLRFLRNAFQLFPRKVKYGSIPTQEDIEKTGDKCPICHDRYSTPVLLRCEHIFCENCIGSWFRNQVTCPMCRAKVVEDMSWLDGSTSEFIQLF